MDINSLIKDPYVIIFVGGLIFYLGAVFFFIEKIENKEPLINELKGFTECILKNKQPPVTGRDGLDALFIAHKFLDSAKRSEVIDLWKWVL